MEFFKERDQQFRQSIPGDFSRSLFHKLDVHNQCTIIHGPEGAGKTTLLLQLAEYHNEVESDRSMFISADDLWLHASSLSEIAELFYLNGGRTLLIDDLHRCIGWMGEVGKIMDQLPDLNLFCTAAVPLPISDELRGRISIYKLPALSFREYLEYKESIRIDAKKLGEIVSFQKEFSEGVSGLFQPIPPFRRYLAGGTLFSSSEKRKNLPGTRLGELRVSSLLDSALFAIEGLDHRSISKMKELLALVLRTGPMKPNISDISRNLDVSRDSVYSWLSMLSNTGLIHSLWLNRKGNMHHRKPDLVLPGDPSMLQFAGNRPDPQVVRLTFLVSQLENAGFECRIQPSGAVYLNGMTIAVGDKNDPLPDVSDGSHPLLAADNLEVGSESRIPLWMFGLLY